MSDKGDSVTVGYWYEMLLHFGLCRGPIDKFLEFRGGDRTAWKGAVDDSTTMVISKRELWGGEKAEGGIDGVLEVMFGAGSQEPNTWLSENQGEAQPGYRGKASAVYRGFYGAMSPYPKPASFKVKRIKRGWDNDVCWYPEKAEIIPGTLTPVASMPKLYATQTDDVGSESTGPYVNIFSFVLGSRGFGSANYVPTKFTIRTASETDIVPLYVLRPARPYTGYVGDDRMSYTRLADELELTAPEATGDGWRSTFLVRTDDGLVKEYFPERYDYESDALEAAMAGSPIYLSGSTEYEIWPFGTPHQRIEDFQHYRGTVTLGLSPADWGVEIPGYMNPAHILYDSLVSSDMMGEPVGLINDASFRAAADQLFTEKFGLGTKFDATSESIEDFQKRICNVIGASLSRSRINGQWYLDLLRPDYVVADLPVLTDDDILEWSAQPGTLDSAVNQVNVEWFDPINKETRTTAPCQALGLIQSFGGIKSDTSSYPEIPTETLALTCAARDLRNKATPVTRFELKTTRTPYAWRPGTCFRLKAPKRGVADMVCRVGEIETGTIRQGAITLTAVQDVFGLAGAMYITPESGVDTRPSRIPKAPVAQRAIEAPYTELVQRLRKADFAQLDADAASLLVMAVQPEKAINYTLLTAAAGEKFVQHGRGDWCPSALITSAAGLQDTKFVFSDGSLLGRVKAGSAALWDDEIVRVDSINLTSRVLVLGRGCVDTVPASHTALSRIWFFDDAAATDRREYVTGETVSARCLTRVSGAVLAEPLAPISSVAMVGRWSLPYPPANVMINGEAEPGLISGDIVVTWAHRNRLTQADKLIDQSMSSITTEPGVTYTARLLSSTGVVLASQAGITGTTATLAATYVGSVVCEVWSERAGLVSYQIVRRKFDYGEMYRVTESGDARVTESGETRITG